MGAGSEGPRLVTLTGPAGTGKTRLALELASGLSRDAVSEVRLVGLAPISDPDFVLSTIGQTLGVPEGNAQTLLSRLVQYLQGKVMLLVLDNFEQVLSAAPLVADLLQASPRLRLLITSRAALRLSGEHEFPVPPLALPDPAGFQTPERLSEYEAVRLFVVRARAVKGDFAVTEGNATVVAEICRSLDGLPLAIELAAARIRLFSPQAMLPRLDRRLSLLAGGARDLPSRQQTLRGAIAWSYDLLEGEEQALFRRLAVFGGGCTPEALEAVCNEEGHTEERLWEQLDSLVTHNLVRRDEQPDGESRFSLLETIREYGLERLEESGGAAAMRQRHAGYFVALAERAEALVVGPEQVAWLNRLEAEHNNVRQVLRGALEDRRAEVGLRLAVALRQFWRARGHWSEGRQWLANLLALPGDVPAVLRAKGLEREGALAGYQGDPATARGRYAESLALWRELGDRRGIAVCLSGLGNTARTQGDYAAARPLLEESLAIWREIGDREGAAVALGQLGAGAYLQGDYASARALCEESLLIWRGLGDAGGVGHALISLGNVARCQGDYKQALTLYDESLAALRPLGHKMGVATVLLNLGLVALSQSDAQRAVELLTESLTLYRDLGAKRAIAWCLLPFASLAMMQGQPTRAVRLYGAVEALLEVSGAPLDPAARVDYERNLAAARAQLAQGTFADSRATGRRMPLEQVIALATEPSADSARRSPAPLNGRHGLGVLSQREADVVALVARGLKDRQIAERLGISVRTASDHVSHILDKLHLASRTQAALWARDGGLTHLCPDHRR
ncbi:MAG: tetratricopeptide repeat protein [Chloroflexota bacterium]|nr:tetratricopeptide repeat protein [Chloroflexota bacterium]